MSDTFRRKQTSKFTEENACSFEFFAHENRLVNDGPKNEWLECAGVVMLGDVHGPTTIDQ